MAETKLDYGQKHVLKLIAKDSGSDGWTPVSAQVYPVFEKHIPPELVELEETTEGWGRVRLTARGQGVIDAMAWL